jgi:DNA-binding MarR family transcriptional regulator
MISRIDHASGSGSPLEQLKAGRRPEIEQLRQALGHLSGAERRLRVRDHGRPDELTTTQLRSLAVLAREREMTAGQLARSVDVNPATVTAMLDQLELADIVKRHRSDEDRRVCNVSLTEHGWKLLERKLLAWQSMWERKLADFSADELRSAARVMQQITELYGEIHDLLENEHAEQAG